MNARQIASLAHRDQRYGDKPYEFHLRKAVAVLARFGIASPVIVDATWLHDTIEDTEMTAERLEAYGVSHEVIEIVQAVTDEPGRDRAARKWATYPKIARLRDAVAVKLADRIANVETRGKVEMYAEEHPGFRSALYNPAHGLDAMWQHLDGLLEANRVQLPGPSTLPIVGARARVEVLDPASTTGEVICISQWIDYEGKLHHAREANGADTISLNICNGTRSLGLDVDNEAVYRGDTPKGEVVWQDCAGEGCFWVFDPRTAILKQSTEAPPGLVMFEQASRLRL